MTPPRYDCANQTNCALQTPSPEIQLEASSNSEAPNRFRRLKGNELVSRGDYVADDHEGFEPWEGLTGFRADAFLKPIYRKDESCVLPTVD